MTYWPLMKNAVTFGDRLKMATFVLTTKKFTSGIYVKQFEKEWSEWLGVKHSLYVSSGSTANFLLLAAIKEHFNLKNKDKVLVPACTWSTNISPVIQLGFTPLFCDINLKNFSFDITATENIAKYHPDIRLVFITHLLGLSSAVEKLQKIFPNAVFIEDVCESHGLEHNGRKHGTMTSGATFSFYFGHHITTIEGGMVCTNNSDLYDILCMKRSHGMAREATPERYNSYKNAHQDISEKFLFMTDGYNFRNHEICAVLGSSQLIRLDEIIAKRRNNYKKFILDLESNSDRYYVPSNEPGNSSYCLPIIAKTTDIIKKIKHTLDKKGIEHRPIMGGNLLRHPAFNDYTFFSHETKPNVEILHENGLYVGNNHFITEKHLSALNEILSDI